ncbi:hypothetical protein C8Q74DRAFT_678160 [Fomes fomentarius]|nr:hypothetical protein C8Q74DRAFT_678160 [Fomes fomentarius]
MSRTLFTAAANVTFAVIVPSASYWAFCFPLSSSPSSARTLSSPPARSSSITSASRTSSPSAAPSSTPSPSSVRRSGSVSTIAYDAMLAADRDSAQDTQSGATKDAM